MNNYRNYKKESSIHRPLYIKGIWDSSFGKLVINQDGNKITGYYTWDDGILYGNLDKNILSGNWNEKPTRKPSVDAGRILFRFHSNEFVGKYGHGNKPLYYNFNGKKICSILLDNCCRYQVAHNASNMSIIKVNGENIEYGQQSSYFYPEKCLPYVELELIIDGEIYFEKIPVKSGFSYTFSIIDKSPDLKKEIIVNNPFR